MKFKLFGTEIISVEKSDNKTETPKDDNITVQTNPKNIETQKEIAQHQRM